MRLASFASVMLLPTVSGAATQGIPPPDAWARAEAEIVRVEPSAFPQLPPAVINELRRLGCRIPQPFTGSGQNVVGGRFLDGVAPDWAVLCSRNGRSSILIFPNGLSAPIIALTDRSDADFLQVVSPGRIGFSRALSSAGPDRIFEAHARHGESELPPIFHDGIEDAFVEKASVIWYRYAGKWIELAGSD